MMVFREHQSTACIGILGKKSKELELGAGMNHSDQGGRFLCSWGPGLSLERSVGSLDEVRVGNNSWASCKSQMEGIGEVYGGTPWSSW